MRHITPLQWDQQKEAFRHAVDGLGKGIDESILELVVALNLSGVNTVASCGGHLDRGLPHPWIDIADKKAYDKAEELRQLEPGSDEYKKVIKELCQLNKKPTDKAYNILREYFIATAPEYDNIFILSNFGWSGARLEPAGTTRARNSSRATQRELLSDYHREIDNLTKYLKEKLGLSV